MQIAKQTKPFHLLVPVLLAIIIGIASRLIPHVPNATPIGAMAIFTGLLFSRKAIALLITLGVLFVSDLILNNTLYASYNEGFAWFTQGVIWIYAAYVGMIFLSSKFIKELKILPVALTAVIGSSLFFILSNFGSFLINYEFYTRDLAGLLACYTAAIPFYMNSLLGDLFFAGVMFGSYAFMVKRQRAYVKA